MANRSTRFILKNNPNSAAPFSGATLYAGEPIVNTAAGIMMFSGVTSGANDWVPAGAGANGNLLLTGARANSSTYHLFAMSKADGTTDYGALLGVANTDPNPTSALPSGYTKFERVGSVLTDASGNIRALKKYEERKDKEIYRQRRAQTLKDEE
jgi:hypothetical protein